MTSLKLRIAACAVLVLCGLALSHGKRRGSVQHGSYRNPPAKVQLRQSERDDLGVDRFNFLDIELLKHTAQYDGGLGNVVLSPASVKTVLSMLWEGADGNTAKELGLALRLDRENPQKQLHAYQEQLLSRAPASAGARPALLDIANQVFISNKLSVSPSYGEALRHYNAAVTSVNMTDAYATAGTINKWVSDATHGHVPSLVEAEALGDEPVMVLGNAVYFQGAWQTAFDETSTVKTCFYTESNECILTPMMETMGSFRSKFMQELEATLIELPYDDDRTSMLILLPERRDGMQELIRNLYFADLLHVLGGPDLEESEYLVTIPKFTIEFNTDLVPVLTKLRIEEVFSQKANLTKMVKDEHVRAAPTVSNVFHKAKIVVEERGTVAAGATGALVVPLMGGPQPRFRAEHPFLFFIRDKRTGGFLFAGRVSRPDGSAAPAAAAAAPSGASAPPAASGAPTADIPVIENEDAASPLSAVPVTTKRSQQPAHNHAEGPSNVVFPPNGRQ